MGVDSVSSTVASSVYNNSNVEAAAKVNADSKAAESNTEEAAVYEKSGNTAKKATYSVNKMSAADRKALVEQLKADQQQRAQSLINIVKDMMGKQASTYGIANGDKDAMWKFIASGNYTVDAATAAQAKKDISEDGYWGVKQTAQRLFDFASALAGDDVDKMKEMQKAMEKGFKLATKAWGKELPSISHDTMDEANKMFENYYASKEDIAKDA